MPGKRKPTPHRGRLTLPLCSVANGVQKISGTQLETLLRGKGVELGDRRLRQLAQEGYFPEPDRGDYEFLATMLGLIAYYRDLHKKKSDSRKEIEDRIAAAKCKIAEKEAAVATDEVETVAAVEKSRIALVTHIRGRLLGLSDKLEQRLAACETSAQRRQQLDEEIGQILTALAEPAFAPAPEPEDGAGEQPRP